MRILIRVQEEILKVPNSIELDSVVQKGLDPGGSDRFGMEGADIFGTVGLIDMTHQGQISWVRKDKTGLVLQEDQIGLE